MTQFVGCGCDAELAGDQRKSPDFLPLLCDPCHIVPKRSSTMVYYDKEDVLSVKKRLSQILEIPEHVAGTYPGVRPE